MSISDIEKKRRRARGRPPTGSTPVLVRLSPLLIELLDLHTESRADLGATRPSSVRDILFFWFMEHMPKEIGVEGFAEILNKYKEDGKINEFKLASNKGRSA